MYVCVYVYMYMYLNNILIIYNIIFLLDFHYFICRYTYRYQIFTFNEVGFWSLSSNWPENQLEFKLNICIIFYYKTNCIYFSLLNILYII